MKPPCKHHPESRRYPSGQCVDCTKLMNAKRRETCKANGICPSCGKRPALEGRVNCGQCHERMRRVNQRRYTDHVRSGLDEPPEEKALKKRALVTAYKTFISKYGEYSPPDDNYDCAHAFLLAEMWDQEISHGRLTGNQ